MRLFALQSDLHADFNMLLFSLESGSGFVVASAEAGVVSHSAAGGAVGGGRIGSPISTMCGGGDGVRLTVVEGHSESSLWSSLL